MQCSETFKEVFDSHGGGCIRKCECGRTFFNPDGGWDWEPGEVEELRQKAAAEPDRYIEQDHTCGTMEIGGKEIVYGCTCDTAERYEKFIISHASLLAEYLNKRVDLLRKESDAIKVSV